jgi:6-phosphogluconolactonase
VSERHILILDDPEAVYVRAAEEIAHIAGEAICSHGEFRICLAGGATPAATYELLATRFHLSIDWKGVQFFWGDERCVPSDDPASNFGMASRTMLSKLEVKPSQVHRVRGEDEPQRAAQEYEAEIKRAFSLEEGELPRFDLILLGLGANSHTASLFPGDPAIHESNRMVVAVEVDDPVPRRISLTPIVLNNAASVMFVVCGTQKAAAVRNVLEGPRDPERFPAQIVAPDGELLWLIDKQAASLLPGR